MGNWVWLRNGIGILGHAIGQLYQLFGGAPSVMAKRMPITYLFF